ncbi:MAG: hypothetical protein ACJ741_12995, partial [Pyrinomonadaceae bacterium]
GANKQIVTATTPASAAEPFQARIGTRHETEAGMTNNACCGVTITTPETMGDEHLFLKVPDSVKADSLVISISIGEPKGP